MGKLVQTERKSDYFLGHFWDRFPKFWRGMFAMKMFLLLLFFLMFLGPVMASEATGFIRYVRGEVFITRGSGGEKSQAMKVAVI